MDVSFGVAEHRGDLGCHHAVRDCKNEERVAELHAGWIRLVAILGEGGKIVRLSSTGLGGKSEDPKEETSIIYLLGQDILGLAFTSFSLSSMCPLNARGGDCL